MSVDALFFIDTKGETRKAAVSLPVIPMTPVQPPAPVEAAVRTQEQKKIVVIYDYQHSASEEADSDEQENIVFRGHSSPVQLGDAVASDEYEIAEDEDSSEADSDYIRNLAQNGQDFLTADLDRMRLENQPDGVLGSDPDACSEDSLGDDEEFAERALERDFLMRNPSTLMEYSLDETAAEFLAQKLGPKKGKGGKGGGKGKKGKAKHQNAAEVKQFDPFVYDGAYSVGTLNFRQINRKIKMFCNDDVEDSLEMDPMPPLPRKLLHELAHMYGLKSKSAGQGRDRHCVLYKTERSGIPRNAKGLKDFIERADKAVTWMDKTVSHGKKFTKAAVAGSVKETRVGRKSKGSSAGNQDAGGSGARPAIGTVIGKDAKPISEENVGNRLLQKLGWKPGEGLGAASDGTVDHVSAVVRGKRTGLGHGSDVK